MKEKTKAFYKAVFKYWWKERAKPLLKKALIVLIIVTVSFIAFTLLMSYLIACGVAAGLEIRG